MSIVSISLNSKILEKLDRIKDELGFSGRSEVIRAALRTFAAENQSIKDMGGEGSYILMVVHPQKSERKVSDVIHDYERIIKTQIHNIMENDKCLEVFILDGPAQQARKMFKKFQLMDPEYIKLVKL